MSNYKIDKNIPVPPAPSRSNYPFGDMEVGYSIQVTPDELLQIRTAASWYGKRNNMKFAIRRYKDGYRCWRVA